ncbi:NAC domain-containing protein 92-like [Triticum aestivum]|uniref:NAC domain-containing protein 92-like n=1 Tax=Triticum aestivum TaxID=4565 RepID=UPI00084452CB|nr:NAC domain-containing protein 92-like [Triticum aestivum]XP_044446234.1 NAC domain-containing protein 92-like [Triticum aestivum]XP_044446827.1 NAC domain-containing protein 92-like [Triticum aestivum]XP_044454439.1 NAC domain-containing protein 92-like [Triticum aestivum]
MSDIAPVQPLALGLLQPEPGFRFHPTGQELVTYDLLRKVHGHHAFIPEVHVYKHEPWELPDKSFSPSTHDAGAKVEWYFFAVRARKYPNGLRMGRATVAGFWKSTGKDRPVMHNGVIVGMKKTLVFHTGRAPGGTRTDWVMHEYRLQGQRNHHIQDAYALCRVFKKNTVAPLIDLSSDADTYEDPMQSVPGGVDTDKDLMEHVSDGADSHKDPKHYVLGGIESDKYLIQSVLRGIGTHNDPILVESDVAYAGKEQMESVLCGVGTDKDHIHVESEFNSVHAGKGKKPFLADRGSTSTGNMEFLAGGANKDNEGMQPVYAGASADEENSVNAWYTAALAEEDNSWMQPPSYDDWYTRVDLDKDDSLMQFIFGDVMLLSTD